MLQINITLPNAFEFFGEKKWVTAKRFATLWDCILRTVQGICFKTKKNHYVASKSKLIYLRFNSLPGIFKNTAKSFWEIEINWELPLV